jgi:hypothetical protein
MQQVSYGGSVDEYFGRVGEIDADPSVLDIGKWQVICHVANHQSLGMELNYIVYPHGKCPLTPLAGS